MSIAVTVALFLVVAVTLWLIVRPRKRRSENASSSADRAVEPRSIPRAARPAGVTRDEENTRTGRDDGTGLVTGIAIGSVLFGANAQASPSDDTGDSHDTGGADDGDDIGGGGDIDSGGDGGFDTGGEF